MASDGEDEKCWNDCDLCDGLVLVDGRVQPPRTKKLDLKAVRKHMPRECYEFHESEDPDDAVPLVFLIEECIAGTTVVVKLSEPFGAFDAWEQLNEDFASFAVWAEVDGLAKHIEHLLISDTSESNAGSHPLILRIE